MSKANVGIFVVFGFIQPNSVVVRLKARMS